MESVRKPSPPWIGSILPAVTNALGAATGPSPLSLPEARSAIVIMVDGLGWELLSEWRGHARTAASFLGDGRALSTCLPSTTAAALTSFTTGKYPGATRMMGYSVLWEEEVMNLLAFAPGVDPAAWQPEETVFTALTRTHVTPYVVTAPKFANSGLTRAAFRGGIFVGRETLSERFAAARQIASREPALVYVYWSDIDHVGHAEGPGSPGWLQALEDFDRTLGDFLRDVPSDTLVVLTADHGMVRTGERIDIADVPALSTGVRALAGEGRAVHVHAEPGQEDEVRARWTDSLAGLGAVIPPERYADVFGAGKGNELLGAAVALLRGDKVVVDSRTQNPRMIAMRGVHGSFTSAETTIPLLLLAAP